MTDDSFLKRLQNFARTRTGTGVLCFGLFILIVWAFSPALRCGFQFYDEADDLLTNPHINGGLSLSNCLWALFHSDKSNWYPLTRFSQMVDFNMFGMNPWGHHLTNLLFHAASGVVLFLVLRRMTGALWRSYVVAALFALHPLRVQSVVWISERKDVLSVFFGLLALWSYVSYVRAAADSTRRAGWFYGLTLLFFTFSLMSKAMLVTFPFLLLLLDYWPLERWRSKDVRALVIEKTPFFLLIIPVSLIAYFAEKSGGSFILALPLGLRLETAFIGYARYLGKMFWPANLCVYYPYPNSWPVWEIVFAAMLVSGASLLAYVRRSRQPYLFTGWFWFLGTLVPVIGIIQEGAQSMADRYTYFPMIGIVLLVVWLMAGQPKRRWHAAVLAVIAMLAVIACIWRTRAEIVYWKDSATLWRRAIAVTTNNYMAHECLGNILWQTDPRQAAAQFQAAVDINPSRFESQLALGAVLMNEDFYSNAIPHYEIAAQLRPLIPWPHNGLASCRIHLGRFGEAVAPLLKAVELDPHNAGYRDGLAWLLFSSGHENETVSNFLETARLDPHGFNQFVVAVENDTNQVALINNIAWKFATDGDAKLRDGAIAVRLARRACEMTQYQTTACLETLAAAYAEDSRFDDAVFMAQRAVAVARQKGEARLVKKNQELLEMFKAHQAYHESAPPGVR